MHHRWAIIGDINVPIISRGVTFGPTCGLWSTICSTPSLLLVVVGDHWGVSKFNLPSISMMTRHMCSGGVINVCCSMMRGIIHVLRYSNGAIPTMTMMRGIVHVLWCCNGTIPTMTMMRRGDHMGRVIDETCSMMAMRRRRNIVDMWGCMMG